MDRNRNTDEFRKDVENLLLTSARHWNSGSIAGFCAAFDDKAVLAIAEHTFHGANNILGAYRTLFPTAEKRGAITLELEMFLPELPRFDLRIGSSLVKWTQEAGGRTSVSYVSMTFQRFNLAPKIVLATSTYMYS